MYKQTVGWIGKWARIRFSLTINELMHQILTWMRCMNRVLCRIRQQQFPSDDTTSLCDLPVSCGCRQQQITGEDRQHRAYVLRAYVRELTTDSNPPHLRGTTAAGVEPFKDLYITLAVTLREHTAGGVGRIKRVTPFVTTI